MTNDQRLNIIVAMDLNRGIGKSGKLPWHLPSDLKYFKNITTRTEDQHKKNAVIMGRKTWESILPKFRPLAQRVNVVLTRQKDYSLPQGVCQSDKFETLLLDLNKEGTREKIESIFVIGGAEIFQQVFLSHPFLIKKLYVTHIKGDFGCDAFFPEFEKNFSRVSLSPCLKENSNEFLFAEYVHKKF